jgi:hypothetical protein
MRGMGAHELKSAAGLVQDILFTVVGVNNGVEVLFVVESQFLSRLYREPVERRNSA